MGTEQRMLHLLVGPSGYGKSHDIMQEIKERAEAGKESILIVPEQFTSTTEQRIYRELQDRLSGYVTSYSFSSLAGDILEKLGGAMLPPLDDANRTVLIRRAVNQLTGMKQLHYYANQSGRMAFYQLAGETIKELKSAGVTPTQMEELVNTPGVDGTGKLKELAAIYGAYEALLAGVALDPTDRVERAAELVKEHPEYFQNQAIYLDEFDTFNLSKRKLLEAMMVCAEQVTVGICGSDSAWSRFGLFSGAMEVRQQLTRLGEKQGLQVKVTQLKEDHRHQYKDLKVAGGSLEEKPVVPCKAEHIRLVQAENRRDEAKALAAALLEARRQGIPYSAMAVICRDTTQYENLLRRQFRTAGIPLYCDGNISPAQTAPARAARAGLGLVRWGATTENIMALVRTGLCALSPEQVSALEGYAFAWNPRASQWAMPIQVRPESYGAGVFPASQEELDLAESARAFLMEPIRELQMACRQAGADRVTHALYRFLNKIGRPMQTDDGQRPRHRALAMAAQMGMQQGQAQADRIIQQWEKLMSLLDQMERLLGTEKMAVEEYIEYFDLLLQTATLGSIPQSNQSVILTGAGRMRLDGVRAAFVMGLTEGEFPRAPEEQGLLTHQDRDALLEISQQRAKTQGGEAIELPDCYENKLVREQICFYKALTVASEQLWLSWPSQQGANPLTSALTQLVSDLGLVPEQPDFTGPEYAATQEMAVESAGWLWNHDRERFPAYAQALKDTPGLERIAQGAGGLRCRGITPREMEALLGRELYLSPTRLENYYKCPFAYFMEYLVKASPRRKAQLTADQGGNLIHWALEQFFLEWEEWRDKTAQEMEEYAPQKAEQLVEAYRKEYLQGLDDDPIQKNQLDRMTANLSRLFRHLHAEFSQSQARPVACELAIGGKEGQIEPLTYTDSQGRTIKLIGKVDRVDLIRLDEDPQHRNFVRVIDYKTGTKKVDLDEVYSGVDCQMLYYLYILTQKTIPDGEGGTIQRPEPAGIIYLLVDPQPTEKGQKYETKGMLLKDKALLEAMEKEMKGQYIPARYLKTRHGYTNTQDQEMFRQIFHRLDELVTQMGQDLYAGNIEPNPLKGKNGSPMACQYCSYSGVCGHKQGVNERELTVQGFEKMKEKDQEV